MTIAYWVAGSDPIDPRYSLHLREVKVLFSLSPFRSCHHGGHVFNPTPTKKVKVKCILGLMQFQTFKDLTSFRLNMYVISRKFIENTQNPSQQHSKPSRHATDSFIWILIMVYYTPYIYLGSFSSPFFALNNPGFFSLFMGCFTRGPIGHCSAGLPGQDGVEAGSSTGTLLDPRMGEGGGWPNHDGSMGQTVLPTFTWLIFICTCR